MEIKRAWTGGICARGSFCAYRNVTVLYLLICSARAEPCPYPCTCSDDWATVTCLESQDIALPLNVSQGTHTLVVRGANISVVPGSAFSALGTILELKTLLLSWNNIAEIKAEAFLGLSQLRVLDLSHNRLMRLSPMAFYGLEELWVLRMNSTLSPRGAKELPKALSTESLINLQRLELSGNRLKAVPIARFDNLNLDTLILTNNSIETIRENNVSSFNEFKKISVYLSLNPFKCDCDLEAFYYWLKNGSQCADSARLLCKLPEAKSGLHVEKLRREDCINAELEAVSYVFLGIVLALIGVVFLMVLYLNRGGIKRWLNNIREACRDQMEVYHYRYEQDSDPRLANVAV